MSSVFSSSASLPCSSSSVPNWKYDVFISFRGEDTRNSFTSFLRDALQGKNIVTYMDEDDLARGDEISPALLRAIEESMISVVVFSENYANSSWCLDELVHILRCKREYRRQVVPVFYKVNPSDVRNQRGNYAIGFNLAILLQNLICCFFPSDVRRKEKVNSWRAALTEAANLAGWSSKDNRPESKLVKVIVEDILEKLKGVSPSCDHEYFPKRLFGIEKHIKKIESLLDIGTQCVHILGIWGMGGMGKTTLADILYKKFASSFKGCCSLRNVREESEKCNGLRDLKVELFSKLSNREVHDPDSTFERERVSSIDVFVVLDDVSRVEQFTYLCGDRGDFFGPGSRFIVTTRDKRALIHQANDVYKLDGLNRDDALGLFHWHAFKETSPTLDFNELSKQVGDYAKGNPLALEISGSFFRGREIEGWENLLERLKGTSIKDEGSIHKILKISYDGLREDEKDAFLDIACFFKGKKKDFVEGLLGVTIIKDLVDKSLVTIKYNSVVMHDLVEEMGRKIVHESSGGDLGKQSRIWNSKDAYSVLHNNIGTEKIEAIIPDWYNGRWETQLDLPRDVFKKMYNLRLIKFSDEVYLSEGLDCLPNKLKYLEWRYYPLKALPKNFNPCHLVVLVMSYSDELEQLWDGVKDLHNLREIRLSYCKNVTQLPDLSRASKLESVILEQCKFPKKFPQQVPETLIEFFLSYADIEEVCSPSSDSLSRLFDLRILGCKGLESLPSTISMKLYVEMNCSCFWRLTLNSREIEEPKETLMELKLQSTEMKELPGNIANLVSLKKLLLDDCEELELLPNTICKLYHLEELSMANCSKLKIFPEIEERMENLVELNLQGTAIKELLRSIENLVSLKKLLLDDCEELELLPNTICKLYHLKELSMVNCSKLKIFPAIEERMENLVELNLRGTAIKELSRSIENLVSLKKLLLDDCKELELLPNTICKLYNLEELSIVNCSKLKIFPEIEEPMENLVELNFHRTAIKELLRSIENLVSLEKLLLDDCEELELLPNTICKLYHLKELSIVNCSQLKIFPEIEEQMENLVELNLQGTAIKELPRSIENLVSLKKLLLDDCKELELLPITICKLYNLEELSIVNCSKLISPWLPPSGVVLDTIGRISLEEILEQHWFDQCIADLSDDGIKMRWPGNKIPRLFGFQNMKSSLSMNLCLNCFDINCLGIAFCAVVDFSGPIHFYSYELCCQAHCDGTPDGVLCTRSYTYWNGERKLHGDYMFISRNEYFMKKLKEYKANRNSGCTSISIDFNFSFQGFGRNMPLINSQNLNLEVKKCGVYLLYATEAQRRPGSVCCGVPSNSHD